MGVSSKGNIKVQNYLKCKMPTRFSVVWYLIRY